jgi:hypothetical protein
LADPIALSTKPSGTKLFGIWNTVLKDEEAPQLNQNLSCRVKKVSEVTNEKITERPPSGNMISWQHRKEG